MTSIYVIIFWSFPICTRSFSFIQYHQPTTINSIKLFYVLPCFSLFFKSIGCFSAFSKIEVSFPMNIPFVLFVALAFFRRLTYCLNFLNQHHWFCYLSSIFIQNIVVFIAFPTYSLVHLIFCKMATFHAKGKIEFIVLIDNFRISHHKEMFMCYVWCLAKNCSCLQGQNTWR